MNYKKTVKKFLAAGLIMSMLLTGCGAGENKGASSASEGQKTQSTSKESTKEDTITVLTASNIDPEIADTIDTSTNAFQLYEMVYDPLVRYGENGEIEPALAESYDVSEDGKVYTFHLRKDVQFSDGTNFNADSVIYNTNRWDDKVKGNFSAKLEKVEKVDDYTVSFTFDHAAYPIIIEFTYPRPFRMCAPSSLDKDGKFVLGVGTGQWKIESYEEGQEAVLVKNEYYYGKQPSYEKVVLKFVDDGQSRVMALQSGDADICLADVPVESAGVLEDDTDVSSVKDVSTLSFFFGLNYDNKIFSDIKVRQALNYATNKKSMVEDIMNNDATAATGIFSSSVPFVTKENSKGYDYNLEKAKELLKEAGYEDTNGDGIVEKDGKDLTLNLVFQTEEYSNWKTICEFIQSEYLKIGVNIELKEMETAAYYDAIWTTRDYDIIIYRSYEDSWNPHGFLSSVFYQSKDQPSVFWYDEKLNTMIGDVIAQPDITNVQEKYDEIFKYMDENAFTIPLYYPNQTYYYNARLSGVDKAATSYQGIVWEDISIN
ncbi:peptide/nickel transport system substrate-binding protein [Acetitomaculum ruminis DSM 5522]|uniref:Peptide/nickel transport system substrate-binding protein n=1 Tax=Acetitomaculum ruminis DSM 5522 TaxID=1120918 RepID=A0A1I0WPM8_9FIRM|nr:ABC transporter substrate-binding protein [Acetitomaculum ruminis]SFA89933.1 peptide/nickel transport system substrate-binding protein [Acetitomaculum ruminis DSM 5522]